MRFFITTTLPVVARVVEHVVLGVFPFADYALVRVAPSGSDLLPEDIEEACKYGRFEVTLRGEILIGIEELRLLESSRIIDSVTITLD